MTVIPTVVAGQLIDPAAWGTPVANMLNQRAESIVFTPVGNTDSPAGTGVWITVGNLTVPAWAAKVFLAYSLTNINTAGAVAGTEDFAVQAKIGTDAGRSYFVNGGVGGFVDKSWAFNDLVTLTATGVKSLTLVSTRAGVGATVNMRANTRSHVTVTALYIP